LREIWGNVSQREILKVWFHLPEDIAGGSVTGGGPQKTWLGSSQVLASLKQRSGHRIQSSSKNLLKGK
jgi:hypothetical protein